MTMRNLLHLGVLAAIVLSGSALTRARRRPVRPSMSPGAGDEFGTIDLTDRASSTSIGTLNLPNNDSIFGMGFGADGQPLRVWTRRLSAHLWQINIKMAAVHRSLPSARAASVPGVDGSGKLYALDQSPTSASVLHDEPAVALPRNVVGSTGFQGDGLVAPNAAGTQVFASAPH